MSRSAAENINVDFLITEIKKRPGLYNKATAEFSNKESKTKLWCEVTQAVFPAWSEWEFQLKTEKVREVQSKWRKLKEMFVKLRTSSRVHAASGKIKKKYKYFDDMDFLLPFLNVQNDPQSTSNQPPEPEPSLHNQEGGNQNQNMELALALPVASGAEATSTNSEIPDHDEDLPKSEPVDEHTHFMLMVVHMMRKLNKSQKHYARTEILRIMRQVDWIGQDNPEENYDFPLPFHGNPSSMFTVSRQAAMFGTDLQPIPIPGLQPNEIDFPNVDGPPELQEGVHPLPITVGQDDLVQEYQVQPGPSCSNDQPPIQLPPNEQRRITILQNQLKDPERDSPDRD